ncbi:hypothetical protein [Metabacillus halosaccharovorans]|uniref:hypothetical protein n=1 Tax=Metabacillus halosaccharovorans TaxID=930124 RepID=UPI003735E6A1
MYEKEDLDFELMLKQLTRDFINRQLQQMKNKGKDNKSFVYLENQTLDLILTYLLMKMDSQHNEQHIVSMVIPNELIQRIDEITNKEKKQFEEIIEMLKKSFQ